MVCRMLSVTATLVIGLLAAQTNLAHGCTDKGNVAPEQLPCETKPKKCDPCLPVTPPREHSYDAIYDLENNRYETNSHVSIVSGSLDGTGCNTRGTLKLALASAQEDPNRRRVLVDLFFENPTGFTFNLGDSKTNNGYAGDSATQSRDAEIHSKDGTLYAWLSDAGVPRAGKAFSISDIIRTRLTLIVGDGHVVWLPDNSDMFNYYYNEGFFALNGQADAEGTENYDLYLGLNQVIDGSYRSGTGLCKVGIKFLNEY